MKKIRIKYMPEKDAILVIRPNKRRKHWADGLSPAQENRVIQRQERYNEIIRIWNE